MEGSINGMNDTAVLARAITWRSSKQSYLTAFLLADRDLVDDCLRGYAYFRWADDQIDIGCPSSKNCLDFLRRERALAESCYRGERPAELAPEEEMLADLIAHDRGTSDRLQSFIRNFFWVLEFDVRRRGRVVAAQELESYSTHLAKAVMDGFQYFIGNAHAYPASPDRITAVLGAHRTHMLRDLREDFALGYVNLPIEALPDGALPADGLDEETLRDWARRETALARRMLQDGRRYIDSLDHLRCKLAGTWYCARFDRVLDLIERDCYCLRADYPERRSLATWVNIALLTVPVVIKHWSYLLRKQATRIAARLEQKPEAL